MKSSILQLFLAIGLNLPLIVEIPAQDRYVDSNADWRGDGTAARPFQNVIEGVTDVPRGGSVLVGGGVYAEKMLLKKPMQLRSTGGDATIGRGVTPGFITCGGGPLANDEDGDGIDDNCEEALAQKFAPIIFHSSDESNFPTSVDWFLQRTSIWFYDDNCFPDLHVEFAHNPSQAQLLGGVYSGNCDAEDTVFSNGTRSDGKHRTFYLSDVAGADRIGSPETRDWINYYHAYPNNLGGVTIQYWRFYAYNDAALNHGGDWEGIHVALDAALNPWEVFFLGHVGIERKGVTEVQWEGTHPRVFSEGGGHASQPTGNGIQVRNCSGFPIFGIDLNDPCTFIRQETWNGGQVRRGQVTPGGGLLNVGAKIAPMNGQHFIQYSGLWGSPGATVPSSGYWGPAFNETQMGVDGFITAWGNGTADRKILREWYATSRSR